MNKRMTWEEIEKKYPEQWVGLTDVEWNGHAPNVRSAIVKYAGESYDIWKRKLAGENIHINCTMHDDMYSLGFLVTQQ